MHFWKIKIGWQRVLWTDPGEIVGAGASPGDRLSLTVTAHSSRSHIWCQLSHIGTGNAAFFPGPTAYISPAPEALMEKSLPPISVEWQTAAPIVLLFLVVQTCDTHLICKTAAMESLVSYRTRSDHSFPEHEANPSCSFSPRHYRKLLESITSQRPLDKLLGEQSSLPKGVAGWKTAEAMHRLDLFLKRQLDCSQCIERKAE